MSIEHDRQKEQAFFDEFNRRILSRIPSNGKETSVKYGDEQCTLCFQEVSRGGRGTYALLLGAYKRHPFRKEMWNEIIGHIDINIRSGEAFLASSPIPHDISVESLVPPLRATEVAFRKESMGEKIDAIEVEENYRGKGYGILLYALGKALLRERGFTEMTIIGVARESEGFYDKLNAPEDPGKSTHRHTSLTFTVAEQRALNKVKIVSAGK